MVTLQELKLTLFFTEGVAMQTWQSVGLLDRELALYRQLAQHGVGVSMVTYGGVSDWELSEFPLHVNRWNLPMGWYKRILHWTLPKSRDQIYKSNQIAGSDLALHTAQRTGAAFVARCGYLLSDIEAKRHGEESSQAVEARELERQVFMEADRAVVTTAAMQAKIIARYALPPHTVHVIPNYVDTEAFLPQTSPNNASLRLGYVGRLAEEKNLFALLEAIAPLDVDLVVVGDGPQLEVLQAQAQRGKARVEFKGNRPNTELPSILNSCDMFILPSLYEGHPKALIEAMACGLPVIGTRVPGIKELLQDGQTGLLCGTEPTEIRTVVERLMNDAILRQRLGAAARQYALDHFALDKIVEQELALYHEVLA